MRSAGCRLGLTAGLLIAGLLTGSYAPLPAALAAPPVARAGVALVAAEAPDAPDAPEAEYLGSFDWQDDRAGFGGFSGLELSADGSQAVVLSDRGYLIEVSLQRDADGLIRSVSAGPSLPLRTTEGEPVQDGNADSEGLRRLADGRLCVSFESNARISCHTRPDAPAELLPRHDDFARMPRNASLESLAVDDLGRLYTLPEQFSDDQSFAVYRFDGDSWSQPFSLPARDGFLATDADFGPDGRLYLLERQVMLTSGFLSRVRSFRLTETGATDERLVIAPHTWRHGNLEGLSVWQEAGGALRLTMIADNAQIGLFRNEIAEYRLSGLAPAGVNR